MYILIPDRILSSTGLLYRKFLFSVSTLAEPDHYSENFFNLFYACFAEPDHYSESHLSGLAYELDLIIFYDYT